MVIWKYGNTGIYEDIWIWVYGDICRFMGIWGFGFMVISRYGDVDIMRYEDMGL